MISNNVKFRGVGIDIRHDGCFSQQITLMEGVEHDGIVSPDEESNSTVNYIIKNSLDILDELKDMVEELIVTK